MVVLVRRVVAARNAMANGLAPGNYGVTPPPPDEKESKNSKNSKRSKDQQAHQQRTASGFDDDDEDADGGVRDSRWRRRWCCVVM